MLTRVEVERRAVNFKLRPVENLLLLVDSYKITHPKQYPPNAKKLVSYYESRGQNTHDPYGNGNTTHTMWYGLQIYLKRYLSTIITHEDVEEAQVYWFLHFGTQDYFDAVAWTKLVERYKGKLPIKIWALPEGSWVKKHNALMMIETTDPEFPWVGQYVETLLTNCWKPIAVATLSHEMWKLGASHAIRTTPFEDINLDFLMNDFGMRGVSCPEDAGIAGSAHLLNFLGTDNNAAITFAMQYYNAPMAGFSVFATEHSTTTSWGKDRELDAYKHFLTQAPKDKIVSMVGDSYDYDQFLKYFCGELKPYVLARSARTVARPDSGYPPQEAIKTLRKLNHEYGSKANKLGYYELNPKVGCIYGDWISYEMMNAVLFQVCTIDQFALGTGALIFGCGGALLQQVTRDTHAMAFKACEITLDENGQDVTYPVFKTTGSKPSKRLGKMMVLKDEDEEFVTVPYDEDKAEHNELKVVYENGELVLDLTWEQVRANVQEAKDAYWKQLRKMREKL